MADGKLGRIEVVGGRRKRIYDRLDLVRLLREANVYRLQQSMYDGWDEGFEEALCIIGRKLEFTPKDWKG